MRTFIAINLSGQVKQHLWKVKNRLQLVSPDVKWVEYENFHLTLKFLGDVKPSLISEINDKLYEVGEYCPPFCLTLDNLGFFPSKTRPRIIWLGLKGETDKAEFLTQRIDAYLSELGFGFEKKRSFHLTIGRIRSELNLEQLIQTASNEDFTSGIAMRVDNFSLVESKLSPGGPRYRMIKSFELIG